MMPRTILVPIDLDDLAAGVLDYAVELAAQFGAQLHVVHAVAPPLLGAEVPSALVQASLDQVVAHTRSQLAPVLAAHRDAGHFASVTIEIGDPVGMSLAVAARIHADLIIIGTHGRRGVSRLVLGSIAEQLARRAPCPITLVPPRPRAVAA